MPSFSLTKMAASMARKWAKILAGVLLTNGLIHPSDEMQVVIFIGGAITALLMLVANIVKHTLGKYQAIFRW